MVAMYNHQQWLTDTQVMGKPRSARLKVLDDAVKQLTPDNPPKNQIKVALDAFNDWADAKRAQGLVGLVAGAEPSAKDRDGRGAFSKLLAQLYLAYLKDDPTEFLGTYTLIESGMSTSMEMTLNAYSDASAQQAGIISDYPARRRLRITNASLQTATSQVSVDVFNVRMVPAAEAVNFSNIESARLSNDVEFMTTGMLSGCCFVALKESGTVFAAHIQPRPGKDGLNLKSKIDTSGRFDVRSLDKVRTFGLGDYGTAVGHGFGGYAMVVGVRRHRNWELYGQDLGVSNNGPPVKVVRIV